MTRAHHRQAIALLVWACVPGSAWAVTPDVGAAGNDHVLWLWVRGLDESAPDMVRFAFRPSEQVGGAWLAHRGPVVAGRVAAATVRDRDLHVIFSDGTHRVFEAVPILFAREGASNSAAARNLPGRATPLALTTDAAGGTLLALVDGRTAVEVLAEQETAARGRRPIGAERTGAQTPTSTQTEEIDSAKAALSAPMKTAVVSYQNGRWRFDRPGPPAFEGEERPLALLADGGVVHVLCPRGVRQSPVLYTSRGASAEWDAGVALHGRGRAVAATGGWLDGLPILALGDEMDGSTSVTLWRRVEGEWRAGGLLLDALDRPFAPNGPWTLAVWHDRVALLNVSAGGDVELGSWRLEDATATEPWTQVMSRGESSSPGAPSALGLVLQYVVLGAILAGILAWRRERVFVFAPLRNDQAPARLSRRLGAFLVDAVILSPAWVPVFYMLVRAGTPSELSAVGQLLVTPPSMSSPTYWAGAAFGALFGLYSGVLELTLGYTPGKRVTGCFVVSEGGDPCQPMSIFLRNLLRVAEFHFTPLLLLVVLTPARQRLGDMLGRTLVVELASGRPVRDSRTLDHPDDAA